MLIFALFWQGDHSWVEALLNKMGDAEVFQEKSLQRKPLCIDAGRWLRISWLNAIFKQPGSSLLDKESASEHEEKVAGSRPRIVRGRHIRFSRSHSHSHNPLTLRFVFAFALHVARAVFCFRRPFRVSRHRCRPSKKPPVGAPCVV
jgi:hypothetical protein